MKPDCSEVSIWLSWKWLFKFLNTTRSKHFSCNPDFSNICPTLLFYQLFFQSGEPFLLINFNPNLMTDYIY